MDRNTVQYLTRVGIEKIAHMVFVGKSDCVAVYVTSGLIAAKHGGLDVILF